MRKRRGQGDVSWPLQTSEPSASCIRLSRSCVRKSVDQGWGADFVVHADPGKGGWAHGTHGMSPTDRTSGPRALHVPCVRCLPWAVLPMEGRADCPQSAAAVQTSSPLFAPPRSSCGVRWQPYSSLLAPREEPPSPDSSPIPTLQASPFTPNDPKRPPARVCTSFVEI